VEAAVRPEVFHAVEVHDATLQYALLPAQQAACAGLQHIRLYNLAQSVNRVLSYIPPKGETVEVAADCL